MQKNGDIHFKGTKGGLLVRIEGDEDYETLKVRLEERLEAAQKFFHGSAITIDIGDRLLTTKQLLELESLFSSRYGVRIIQVVNGSADAEGKSGEVEARTEKNGSPAIRVAMVEDTFASGDTLLIKRTARSGQRISYNGNVVILGDVNPGAEVIASGDIVVMGRLRGVVHAGATGNDASVILAFRLCPTQLRIGNLISRAPDWGANGEPEMPEMAKVRDGEVVIYPFPG